MKWNKIRLVIIILLVVANVYLAIQLISLNKSKNEISVASVDSICDLLNNNNISISHDLINKSNVTRDVVKVSSSFEYYTNAAYQLFEKQNGKVIDLQYLKDKITYVFENGATVVFDSDFNFKYKAEKDSDDLINSFINLESFEVSSDYSLVLINVLNSYFDFNCYLNVEDSIQNIKATYNIEYRHHITNTGYDVYCLTQVIDGVKIEDYRIYCLTYNDEIVEINGTCAFFANLSKVKISNYDIINALFNFNNYINEYRETINDKSFDKLTVINVGRSFTNKEYNDVYYLFPSLSITLDNGYVFIVNLYDLEVTYYNK